MILLQKVNYKSHDWEVLYDIFSHGSLVAIQKKPMLSLLRDNRAGNEHYNRKNWPQREEFGMGKKNVKC